jgi:hypothetical protein
MKYILSILLFISLQAQGQVRNRAHEMFHAHNKVSAPAGATYDPDAQDYFDRSVALGGYDLSEGEKSAVNTYIVGLKAASVWDKVYDQCLYTGATAAAHSVTLRGRESGLMTDFGAPAHSAMGVGPLDGTTQYQLTNVYASIALTANNTHLAIYSRTAGAGGSGDIDFSAILADNQSLFIIIRRNTGASYAAAYDQNTASGLLATTVADGSGLFVASRTSAGDHRYYRNAALLASQSTTGGALPATYLAVGSGGGSATNFKSARQYCFWSAGLGLTPTEVATFTTLVNNLQTALGRNTF